MNEDLLPENRKEVDDQDPKLQLCFKVKHHEHGQQRLQMAQNLGRAFNQVTDEEGKKTH